MKRWYVLWIAVCLALSACGQSSSKEVSNTKELLVFCGITMVSPVKELMESFERQTGVKMTMSYGGSTDLLNSVLVNKTGDIYFPGTESYIAEADKAALLKERRLVGSNQAALFVAKGNPKAIAADVHELLRPGLRVAIGHPDLGSVGREAQDILTRKGIYDKVVAASAMMLPDSKALSATLREGKVDLVLNWTAAYFTGDNAQHMERLPLAEPDAKRHALTMATTVYSAFPAAAVKFLDYCASPEGRVVFAKYGF